MTWEHTEQMLQEDIALFNADGLYERIKPQPKKQFEGYKHLWRATNNAIFNNDIKTV